MTDRKNFIKALILGAGASMLSTKSLANNGEGDVESMEYVAMDEYGLSLRLQVPQVLDNTKSLGYRTYRSQMITGPMYIVWLEDGSFEVKFGKLVNNNFKVGGEKVTYEALEMKDTVYSRFVYIGNNKTEKFIRPCLAFFAQLLPSYAIGEPEEDNSFSLMLSGKGVSAYKQALKARVATKITGYVSGIQGCGCAAYGHKSPTRDASMDGSSTIVDDVVPTFGMWTAKWKKRYIC